MYIGKVQTRRRDLPVALGERMARIEDGFVRLGTERVYRFRERHPLWFGLIAGLTGSGLLAIITVMSYGDWSFEGINLTAAVYQLVGGAFAGGVAAVFLAFAYARTVRPILSRGTAPKRVKAA